MERPPESLKSFANRVASLAQAEGSAQMLRLLRFSGFLGADASGRTALSHLVAPARDTPPPANPTQVGIWERKTEGGRVHFMRRREMMDEWVLWANVGRIEARGAKKRVVLVGESVARGYLYDPEFTPAIALEAMLKAKLGAEEVEVIDLARTNLSYRVRELALGALQLEPDVVVVFAGNNWDSSEPSPSEIMEADEALTTEGIRGAKRASEAHISRNARRVVNDIASAYAERKVPLVWMIPEFNLADWRDPVTNAPHLPGDLNREWLELLDEAEAALRDGDDARASSLASRMVEIDGGLCAKGFYILAECSERAGETDAARRYLERARDAVSWDTSRMTIPRPLSSMQEAVREEVRKYPVQLVDLPAVFREHLGGGIPGRRLVIDYVHLTSEGIRVAMAEAAARVVRALTGAEVEPRELAREDVAPSKEVEADVCFLAAALNAHHYQPYDVVRHYCSRALSLSPHVAELMIAYLELQALPRAPMMMSEPGEKLYRLGSRLIHHYLLRLNIKRVEKVLYDAAVDALAEAGVDARERLDRFRREQLSVTRRETSLLEYYSVAAVSQPQELAWLFPYGETTVRHEAEYYKAYWPESRFVFFAERGHAVSLSLTCRLPAPAGAEALASVALNGETVARLAASREWGTWEIDLAGEAVRDGLNELSVWWPAPEFPGAAAIEKVRMDLFERKFPGFYPVFGEIHSFTASGGRKGFGGSAEVGHGTAVLESS
jgi:hypothetical protein